MSQTIATCYSPVNSIPLIGLRIAPRYRASMEIKEIRRKNLGVLLENTTHIAFAEKAGMAAAHVSQIVNGSRNMGDKIARRIEKKLSLPVGWMDGPKMLYGTRDPDEPLKRGIEILTAMEPEARHRAVKILAAMSEPAGGNGENGEPGADDAQLAPRKKKR